MSAVDLGKSFRERLVHDAANGELRDGAIRYLTLRPDALMGLFARLPEAARAQAFAALAASVAEHGGKSIAAYRASGAAMGDALRRVIVETSAQLGWGVFEFADLPDGAIAVTVRNSPFAQALRGQTAMACAPIVGILTAIAPHLIGPGAVARETRCAASHNDDICRFELRAAA